MNEEIVKLASILEALQDCVYISNHDFVVEFMNKAMVKLFGPGVGKKCFEVVSGGENICPWCQAEDLFVCDSEKTLRREVFVRSVDRTFDVIEMPLHYPGDNVFKLTVLRDITQKRSREEKLRVVEEDYRRLFEHVGCGVYISSREGKFLNANQALLDMLGYESKEEFLSMDITHDLYFSPEHRRIFQKMIERDGFVIEYEVDFKHKTGKAVPTLLTAHVRLDSNGRVLGYEGIMLDQTQRRQMEARLREANDFLNKIIKNSPNAIFAADLDGGIIIWNKAAEEITGHSAENVIGKLNIDNIYPAEMSREVMRMLRNSEYGGRGKLSSYPLTYIRPDGSAVEGNLSAAIIYDAEGAEIAVIGIFVDLHQRLEMESKLRQTQEQLLQSEKLAAMGRLISQIAHELNNPLYGIMNTLELMKSEIKPGNKRRKVLEMALSETERVTDMLRKMLSFSKPDQEERTLNDINTILEEILLLMGKQLRERNIKLQSHLGEGLGKVRSSKNQLRQVFLNMIANAREAMVEGGTLSVNSRGNGSSILVEIADTGVGIPPKNLDRIFDAFFTTKDSVKGVGLGLSVCYGFIKDHGGDIKVESVVGSGARFTIVLPTADET